MGDPLFVIVVLAVLAVAVVLALGIGGFAKGGAFSAKYSNKLMQLRIAAQAVAVALILLYIYLKRQGS
ncbi:MAG: twin transmembrane helix small protein [Pseudodonghicola sp.]|nr:twin transmembrane helix small protein [Pseudodonghicola sp.]